MLCRKGSRNSEAGTVPVYLNVYDLTPINGYAYWFGLGVYHSGVQVHGIEYAFGAHEYPTTGIFEGEPKQCDGFTFRKTILIGKTDMGQTEVRAVMEELAGEYRGNAYNLITKNCNHFCNDACLRLTGNPIPSWVNRLARIGFLCNCVLPVTLNTTKVGHHRIEDKPCEEEKKKITSDSNRLTCSNSSSSSSSPSSSTIRRGRSRNRRALPPTSPLIMGSQILEAAAIMSRGESYGGGQSSLGYLFGSDQKPSTVRPPSTQTVNPPPYGIDTSAVDQKPPAGHSPTEKEKVSNNNYHRAQGQNSGNFITDRPSTKVKSVPGGDSSLGYLFGDK